MAVSRPSSSSLLGDQEDSNHSHPPKSIICQKLVLRGEATSKDANYTLYLKVAIPKLSHQQTYDLFPDQSVHLISSSIDALNSKQEALVLSDTAAEAAEALGINLSINSDTLDLESELSPNSNEGRNGINGRRRRRSSMNHGHQSSMPSVTIANYNVAIKAPPMTATSSIPSIKEKSMDTSGKLNSVGASRTVEKRFFMVTLRLRVNLASGPPNWPPTVILPVPKCLLNHLRFNLDRSALDLATSESSSNDSEVLMSFDPGLKPISRSRNKGFEGGLSDSSFDDDSKTVRGEDANGRDDEEEEGAEGSFQSTEEMVVRWAVDNAAAGASASNLPAAFYPAVEQNPVGFSIRAEQLETSLLLQVGSSEFKSELEQIEVGLKWECELKKPFYRGLEDHAHLQLFFDSLDQELEWIKEPSLQMLDLKECLHSSPFIKAGSVSNSGPSSLSGSLNGSSPQTDSTEISQDSTSISPWLKSSRSRQKSEDSISLSEMDILKEALPKELRDSDLDFSMDSFSPQGNQSKKSRHSLGSKVTSRNGSNEPRPAHDQPESALEPSQDCLQLVLHVNGIWDWVARGGNSSLKFSISSRAKITSMNSGFSIPILRLGSPDSISSHSLQVKILSSKGEDVKISAFPKGSNASGQSEFQVQQVNDLQTTFKDTASRSQERCLVESPFKSVQPTAQIPSPTYEQPSPSRTEIPLPSLGGVGDQSLSNTSIALSRQGWSNSSFQLIKEGDRAASKSIISFSSIDIFPVEGEDKMILKLKSSWPSLPLEEAEGFSSRVLPHFCLSLGEMSVLGLKINDRVLATSSIYSQQDQISIAFPSFVQMETSNLPEVVVLFSVPFKSTTASTPTNLPLPAFPSLVQHLQISIHLSSESSSLSASTGPQLSFQSPKDTLHLNFFTIAAHRSLSIDIPKRQTSSASTSIIQTNPSTSYLTSAPKRKSIPSLIKWLGIIFVLVLNYVAVLSHMDDSVRLLSRRIDSLAMALDIDFPSQESAWKPQAQVSPELLKEASQGWNRNLEDLGYSDDDVESTDESHESAAASAASVDQDGNFLQSNLEDSENRRRDRGKLNKDKNLFPKGSGNVRDLSSHQATSLDFHSSNWLVILTRWLGSFFWRR